MEDGCREQYSIKQVAEVCHVRKTLQLSCNGCIYKGKACEKAKHTYNIEEPRQYFKLKEKQQ